MKVWRIAHESEENDGFPTGPYAGGHTLPRGVYDKLETMHLAHCDSDHPTPYVDAKLRGIGDYERCGFDSDESLYQWFANFTALLHDCGFRVYTYDVPDNACRVGRVGQVVFAASMATLIAVEEIDLSPAQLSLFDNEKE